MLSIIRHYRITCLTDMLYQLNGIGKIVWALHHECSFSRAIRTKEDDKDIFCFNHLLASYKNNIVNKCWWKGNTRLKRNRKSASTGCNVMSYSTDQSACSIESRYGVNTETGCKCYYLIYHFDNMYLTAYINRNIASHIDEWVQKNAFQVNCYILILMSLGICYQESH